VVILQKFKALRKEHVLKDQLAKVETALLTIVTGLPVSSQWIQWQRHDDQTSNRAPSTSHNHHRRRHHRRRHL